MSENTKALWLERVGTRQYRGRSADGREVLIGEGEGFFSPGDLLKLALAGCQAMSSDARFAQALGSNDFELSAGVSAQYDKQSDRFTSMAVELVTDLSSLDQDKRADLERRARAAIERNCTIGHTLETSMPFDTVITSE